MVPIFWRKATDKKTLLQWACICFTYIRFHEGMKVQGIDRNTLPFKSPLQPYLSYYGLIMSIFMCVTSPSSSLAFHDANTWTPHIGS
mgnify:CR=1 FL=1